MTVRCGKGSWDVDKKEHLGELVSGWPAGFSKANEKINHQIEKNRSN